jgi:mannose-6-phosphate isomerase-like protein (cupin superfamily)
VPDNVTAEAFLRWVDGYERAWRSPGTEALAELFAADASYLQSPYAEPHVGLDAIRGMWEQQRDGPDESFTMKRDVVSVSGDVGVARVEVFYGDPVVQEYRDLWLVRFDGRGRAVHFEEWPFWPGHPWSPRRADPVVTHASDVNTDRYAEFVRTTWLSGGVYRLAAGASDDQTPHKEDEVYVVTRGRAALEVEGRSHAVEVGSVAFVPARAEHRFVDIGEDLEVIVVFAPPEKAD